MGKRLFTGFKGKNNASALVVSALPGEHLLLTNSFGGVKKDIEAVANDYDCVIMFGIDKSLKDSLRIEKTAERDGERLSSEINLQTVRESFKLAGLKGVISDTPTHYLCNEAYWYALKKFEGRAVFIHVPTLKDADGSFIEKIVRSFEK